MKPQVLPRLCWLSPPVDLLHRDVEALGNVLHGLAGGRNDAHALGDGLGRDGVVASDHDDLSKGQASDKWKSHGDEGECPLLRSRKQFRIRAELCTQQREIRGRNCPALCRHLGSASPCSGCFIRAPREELVTGSQIRIMQNKGAFI